MTTCIIVIEHSITDKHEKHITSNTVQCMCNAVCVYTLYRVTLNVIFVAVECNQESSLNNSAQHLLL